MVYNILRPNHTCECGNSLFEKTYEYHPTEENTPAWKCNNCAKTTKRIERKRRTNNERLLDFLKEHSVSDLVNSLYEKYCTGDQHDRIRYLDLDYHYGESLSISARRKLTKFELEYHTEEMLKVINQIK